MTRYLRHGILMLAAILLVAGVQTVVAQDAAQKKGAELYASLCASCHTPTPAKMMGKMTLSYGTAQILAPALTGWLATRSGSYDAGLYVAAAAMIVGRVETLAILALFSPEYWRR